MGARLERGVDCTSMRPMAGLLQGPYLGMINQGILMQALSDNKPVPNDDTAHSRVWTGQSKSAARQCQSTPHVLAIILVEHVNMARISHLGDLCAAVVKGQFSENFDSKRPYRDSTGQLPG